MVYPELLLEPPKCAMEALEEPQFQLNGDDSESQLTPEPEPIKLELLSPEHPLLQKFQEKLKKHLLHTKNQWLNDISELEYQIKCKLQMREEKGSKLYDMQQDIHRQNDQLEEFARSIQEQIELRRKREEEVALLRTEYEKKWNICKEEKTLCNKRLVELEHLNTLEGNIRRWANEIEDEVKNAKRAINREGQLQRQLSEKKKKLDMLYYHLDTEVKNREIQLQVHQEELRDTREGINLLHMSIHSASIDLQSLQKHDKSLTQAWGEVIVAINHRDKILYQVCDATTKEKELIKLKFASIEATKKQITKEMVQNEKLETFKTRLLNDFNELSRQCKEQSGALATLEKRIEELPRWLKESEKDLDEAKKECNQLEIEIRRIQWKIDKEHTKKFEMEENILKLAQDQLINDKANQYRLKLLDQSQEKRRGMEYSLNHFKNQFSETILEFEKCKGVLRKLQTDNEKLRNKLVNEETRSNNLNCEMKNLDTQIDIRQKRIDKLSHQLAKELEKMEDGSENSVTTRKIVEIEKAVQNAELQIRKDREFWLVLQNHNINLTQKRNDQLNEKQVAQKQLSIITQKSMKIDDDVEKSEVVTREIDNDIKAYLKKVVKLNEKVFKKHCRHETEESECEEEHARLLATLKENEMAVLNLEGEISELQTDIESYKDLVLDKHREVLTWETKCKLVVETLRWRKKEQALDSEISTMKNEIQRLKLRYTQLTRQQEKMSKEMVLCVIHRETMFSEATFQMRAESTNTKTAISAQQKVIELRNKLKQIQNEISALTDEQLVDAMHENEQLQQDIENIHNEIGQENSKDELIRTKIEEGFIVKLYNLENIVRTQNRAKSYRKLSSSGTTLAVKTPRSETTLQSLMQKQTDVNEKLCSIVQTLITDLPQKKNFFIKISQVLN